MPSSLALRPGLSWCRCGGRAVFLDLPGDRYFCLSPRSEQAFLALAAHRRPEREALEALVAQRIVLPAPTRDLSPARCGTALGDQPGMRGAAPRRREIAAALAAQACAAVQLRTMPLARIVSRLARGGCPRPVTGGAAADRAARVAAAFEASGLVLHAADRCLPRALALAAVCRRRGLRPDLVFGVRLDPFQAHCWVQLGDHVLIGSFEQVRTYVPILVVR